VKIRVIRGNRGSGFLRPIRAIRGNRTFFNSWQTGSWIFLRKIRAKRFVAKNSGGEMTDNWPDREEFWRIKRVMVTGGNGFLGKPVLSLAEGYVVRKLILRLHSGRAARTCSL
jgi:hypothetical protein